KASPSQLRNWRFKQALFRAYYDVYVRRRLIYETDLEQDAMKTLSNASTLGSSNAIASARSTLDRTAKERVAGDLRARIFELGEGGICGPDFAIGGGLFSKPWA